MSDYTPSVEALVSAYVGRYETTDQDRRAEFDRMIEAVRAETLRNFAHSIPGDVHDARDVADLARGVADHIEKEAGL